MVKVMVVMTTLFVMTAVHTHNNKTGRVLGIFGNVGIKFSETE